jgi:SAM-dependent methyltransferase
MKRMNKVDYVSVTEISGDEVTQEQINRLSNRYYWAANYCRNRDTLEVACGSGQALGYLNRISKTFVAGDYSKELLSVASRHYGDRINLQQFDAQHMPFPDDSKDVIIIFEAIYYLPDADAFLNECTRVLRTEGNVLVATANKDLYDFNPSPHSHQYYGVVELNNLFESHGFRTEFFGDTPVTNASLRQKILRPLKRIAVALHLIPKSMAGKKILKRLVFGNLTVMPAEIDEQTAAHQKPTPLYPDRPDTLHKVIYCAATLQSKG